LCAIREDDRREETWTAFHARYRAVILGWCARRGLPRADAEDLTQDVLLKLFQQLPAHNHDPARGRFRGWLKTVVNNALRDFWRRHRGAGAGALGLDARAAELADPDAVHAPSTTATEDRTRNTATEIVNRVRAKLKETTWQAFYQVLVEKRPAAEVAAGLSLSVATVYKATYRVKQMLSEECGYAPLPAGGPDPVPERGGTREVPA
jgi:RNA polymerase sigma-70 factor (ECF subfamily)